MIEDVMYGLMFKAKIDIVSKEPPVKALKKLNASPVWLEGIPKSYGNGFARIEISTMCGRGD